MTKREQRHVDRIFNISKQSDESLLKDLGLKKYGDYKNRKKRISKFGINTAKTRSFHHLKHIFFALILPFNVLLLSMVIADISIYFTLEKTFDHIVSAIVSMLLLLITVIIHHIQEYKTWKINFELNNLISNQFLVLKHSIDDINNIHPETLQTHLETITHGTITIGDVVVLKAGDIAPTDLRIIWAKDLIVNDSYIRGEVKQVFKNHTYDSADHIYDLKNIVLSGTTINSGYALGVVFNIREHNTSHKFIKKDDKESHSFYQRGIKKITFALIMSIFIIFPVMLFSTYFSSNENGMEMWIKSVLFAITIVISLIPESLPAIIDFNLQYGGKRIKNEKIIVKNFSAVQDIGAVDILLTNKSGNVTKDRPILVNCINFNLAKDENVYNLAFLNAYFQNATNFNFEKAIIEQEDDHESIINGYELITAKQLESHRKIGSVILKKDNEIIQISKGSTNEIFPLLKYFKSKNTIMPITEEIVFKIRHQIESYVSEGFRIALVASKKLKDGDIKISNDELIYEGICLFKDLIHEEIYHALDVLNKYGINYKLLSGDSVNSTKWVGQQIGMKDINTLTGGEMKNISLKELQVIIRSINIFAEMSPLQKATIIYNYKKNKNVVAYMGDGVGDVVAIRKADVGIAPNTSTPIAKHFADIIMTEKNLNNLDNAFLIGRKTFVNTIKYIQITIAANIGLLLSLLITSIWFPFLPMTSNQLLLQTLFIDIANVVFIYDHVDSVSIQKPIKWSSKKIIRFIFINGFIPVIISMINLLIISYGLGWFRDYDTNDSFFAEKIQTTFYIESFLTHILIIYVLRTEGISIIKKRPRFKFNIIILITLLLLLSTVYIPNINTAFGMIRPDWVWWSIMFGMIILAWSITELFKYIYKKIFKIWF